MYDEFTSLELDRPEPWLLRLTLRTPGKLNAVGPEAHGQLAHLWQVVDRDPETRVVMVRGADGAFSSGGDLGLVEDIASDWATRARVFKEARDLVYNVIDCPKPIVAAMAGPAVGAGLAVGLLADVSLATPSTMLAVGAARLMSASSATASPAPTHGPSMAATTGLPQSTML